MTVGALDPDAPARARRRTSCLRGRRARAEERGHRRPREAASRTRCSPARRSRTASTRSASTATSTTTRSGPTCVELGIAPVSHSAVQYHRVTRSISNYVYNHIGGLVAVARGAVQVAVPRRRDAPLPRAAGRLPRGRRRLGVQPLRRPRRPLGEAQRRHRSSDLDPDNLDVDELMAVLRRVRRRCRAAATSNGSGTTSPARARARAARRVRRVRDREARGPPSTLFERPLLLRLRGRRPAASRGRSAERREPARRASAPDLRLRHRALGRPRHDRAGRGGVRARRARRHRRAGVPRAHVPQPGAAARAARTPTSSTGTSVEAADASDRRGLDEDGGS